MITQETEQKIEEKLKEIIVSQDLVQLYNKIEKESYDRILLFVHAFKLLQNLNESGLKDLTEKCENIYQNNKLGWELQNYPMAKKAGYTISSNMRLMRAVNNNEKVIDYVTDLVFKKLVSTGSPKLSKVKLKR